MPASNPTIPGRQVAELLIAIALILWRIVDRSAERLWMDWILLLCLYWIASIVAGPRNRGPAAAGVFVAALMILYLWGQLPQALVPLGLGR